ncbi:MAG TPA: SDR family NAD(P)-dependent oxidoreductase, partial [Candidatus Megaira endosymbiont of Hartmannula sinica]|nr:SDR family NAD(P)-dependent oxidoreductase [Candidatus Megaera endosymbiont of Hartmannula sinica]
SKKEKNTGNYYIYGFARNTDKALIIFKNFFNQKNTNEEALLRKNHSITTSYNEDLVNNKHIIKYNNHILEINFLDIENEESINKAAKYLSNQKIILKSNNENIKLSKLIIATGILHNQNLKLFEHKNNTKLSDAELMPEKSLKEINPSNLINLYKINTIGPIIIVKHFIGLMKLTRHNTLNNKMAVIAILSGKVGSISDNYLGGWHGYRSSKAALNMIIKNIAIEYKYKFNNFVIISIHPGTVTSNLSKPFIKNLPKDHKLMHSYESADNIIKLLNNLDISNSGKIMSYNGSIISY